MVIFCASPQYDRRREPASQARHSGSRRADLIYFKKIAASLDGVISSVRLMLQPYEIIIGENSPTAMITTTLS